MTVLSVDGVEVGRYGWDDDPPPGSVARPAVHPLRTLAGTVLTDAHPKDHPWHRGLGLALPDVDGVNLWGGPSYLPGEGYQDAGHGLVRQRYPRRVHADAVEDSLTWSDGSGTPLLYESRQVSVAPCSDGWTLRWSSTLTAASAHDAVLASPGSHGRVGAGYGGFFWRLRPVGADGIRVFTPDAEGECAVNGAHAPWLAVSHAGWTAVVAASDARTAADPWFVRVAEYAAIGSALAWDRPLRVAPREPVPITLRLVFVDRACDRADVPDLLAAS